MASKQKNAHQKLETELAQGNTVHGDLLWDFAFEQMVILTNQLLHAKALPLSQVMHVVHSFAYATETASSKQQAASRHSTRTALEKRLSSAQRM